MTITKFFNPKNFLNNISLDCVVFGFHSNQLKVLLLKTKFSHNWALPGGFVQNDESLEDAAAHVLKNRTGADNIFLKQFKVFSNPKRSSLNPAAINLLKVATKEEINWFNNRFISIGFYALVNFSRVNPTPDSLSDKCEWKNLDEIETLMMDHNLILEKALSTLRLQLHHQPIGYNLLQKKFTIPELQKLYEAILGKQLDRRNFQRKILSYKIMNKLEERKIGGAYKAPFLYEFNLGNYKKALKNGLSSGW